MKLLLLICALLLAACSPSADPTTGSQLLDVEGSDVEAPDVEAPDASFVVPDTTSDLGVPPTPITVVTFNTGTGPSSRHDEPPDDGYTSAEATITDEWYGNGLNWPPLIAETRAFFDEVQPDLVVFQEIFWTGDCPDIPVESHAGFACEGWSPGDPTVAQLILGDDYQVACHPGKPDKCAAVRREFGTFRGCDEDFCLEGMSGFAVPDCGSGARVARVVVDRVEGDPLTLVNVHGTSGFSNEDVACRVAQVDQIFVDLGDGEPGVNGANNLVMGDLNTDPGRLDVSDASARRWLDFVGSRQAFRWHTEVGLDAEPTYALLNIDHVTSDSFDGECWHAGVGERPAVSDIVYFDHRPAVCELIPR